MILLSMSSKMDSGTISRGRIPTRTKNNPVVLIFIDTIASTASRTTTPMISTSLGTFSPSTLTSMSNDYWRRFFCLSLIDQIAPFVSSQPSVQSMFKVFHYQSLWPYPDKFHEYSQRKAF